MRLGKRMKKIAFIVLLILNGANYAADKQIIAPEKAALCASCHGQQGISTNPQWPNIAGQHASYLIKQLNDYKNIKTRNVPIMTTIASQLNEVEMTELSNYYAKQPLAKGSTPEQYVKRGEQLYRGGDLDKHIAACIACHGPKGIGNAQAKFPLLSGQNQAYTLLQLQAFKNKKRTNDLNSIMQDISQRMSEEDMKAVSYYIQGLH